MLPREQGLQEEILLYHSNIVNHKMIKMAQLPKDGPLGYSAICF